MNKEMDIMDTVMQMRSENSRILTRSARNQTQPVAPSGQSKESSWHQPSETEEEKTFNDSLSVGEKENAEPWDLKLPPLKIDKI